jgi:hypothetical protein
LLRTSDGDTGTVFRPALDRKRARTSLRPRHDSIEESSRNRQDLDSRAAHAFAPA